MGDNSILQLRLHRHKLKYRHTTFIAGRTFHSHSSVTYLFLYNVIFPLLVIYKEINISKDYFTFVYKVLLHPWCETHCPDVWSLHNYKARVDDYLKFLGYA